METPDTAPTGPDNFGEVAPQPPAETSRVLTPPPGGIMTKDVGAITGPVEIALDGDEVRVRYEGAAEWYTIVGSAGDRSVDELTTVLTTDPGVDEHGNAASVSLEESPSSVE